MTDTNRPLWEVMDDSYGTHLTQEESYGAMMRAIAEEISKRVELWHADDVIKWLHKQAHLAEAGE
jgi:hypothetical protein